MTNTNTTTIEEGGYALPPRLGSVATKVLDAAAKNPPAWAGEFDEWAHKYVGPRPTWRQGVNDWECVMLGAILAWGYLAVALAPENEGEGDTEEAPADVANGGGGDGAGPADGGPVPGVREVGLVGVRGTYAVLGPTGEPLVEGLK